MRVAVKRHRIRIPVDSFKVQAHLINAFLHNIKTEFRSVLLVLSVLLSQFMTILLCSRSMTDSATPQLTVTVRLGPDRRL
jgi:hypothetical protein